MEFHYGSISHNVYTKKDNNVNKNDDEFNRVEGSFSIASIEENDDDDHVEDDSCSSFSISFCTSTNGADCFHVEAEEEGPSFFIPDNLPKSVTSSIHTARRKCTGSASQSTSNTHRTDGRITNSGRQTPPNSMGTKNTATTTHHSQKQPKQKQHCCYPRKKVVCQSRRPTLKVSNESSILLNNYQMEASGHGSISSRTSNSRTSLEKNALPHRHNRTLWRRVAFVAKENSKLNRSSTYNGYEDGESEREVFRHGKSRKLRENNSKVQNGLSNKEENEQDQDFVLRLQREIQENHTNDASLRAWFLDCLDHGDKNSGTGNTVSITDGSDNMRGLIPTRVARRENSRRSHPCHHDVDEEDICEPSIPIRRRSSQGSSTLFSIDENKENNTRGINPDLKRQQKETDDANDHDNDDDSSSTSYSASFLRRTSTCTYGLHERLLDLSSIVPSFELESQASEKHQLKCTKYGKHSYNNDDDELHSSSSSSKSFENTLTDAMYKCNLDKKNGGCNHKTLQNSSSLSSLPRQTDTNRNTSGSTITPSSSGWSGSLAYMATYRS